MLDPTALLSTDLRILVEDKKYIVVAVRLDKEALKRNVPFLWSALEVTSEPSSDKIILF